MRCDVCDVEIHGHFEESLFHRLDSEDLLFLEQYMLADFSIKALAERSSLGYAAIRSRLDRIIGNYRELQAGETEKRRILEKLSNGEITAAEATRRISEITGR